MNTHTDNNVTGRKNRIVWADHSEPARQSDPIGPRVQLAPERDSRFHGEQVSSDSVTRAAEMPYYSDFGIYTGPSVPYSTLHLTGPYANHSSIIASNFVSRPYSNPVTRNYRYKPHLSTISESSALRRLNSPKLLLHSSPKYTVPKPIKINTADIDVSVNKYRKYERPGRSPLHSEKEKRASKSPSPAESPSEELPARPIRRDRPSVRLHTVYKKGGDEEPQKEASPSTTKAPTWREQIQLDDLDKKEERPRKTPGEKLVEKHLLKEEQDQQSEKKKKKKESIPKTPSFHEICRAISSDTINEILNPGQPEEVQRKQSRQFTEELLKEVNDPMVTANDERDSGRGSLKTRKRIGKKKSNEVAAVLKEESFEEEEKLLGEARDSGRGSSKTKKKITKKKSDENVVLQEAESVNKSKLQRRPTLKKIRRNSTDSSLPSVAPNDAEVEQAYQEAIRDISQVEVEEIKRKPKPIITGTVDFETSKPNLKAVIDDVEVEEVLSPKTKKGKPRFNFTIGEVQIKQRPNPVLKQQGVVALPKGKRVMVTDVAKRKPTVKLGQILEETPKRPAKPKQAKPTQEKTVEIEAPKTEVQEDVVSSKPEEKTSKVEKKTPKPKPIMYTAQVVVNKASPVSKVRVNSNKPKDAKQNAKLETIKKEDPPEEAALEANLKGVRSSLRVSPKPFLNIQTPQAEPAKDENDNQNFWDLIATRESVYYNNRKNWLPKNENREPVPTIEDVANNNDVQEVNKEIADAARPVSKSSLVFKRGEVEDPDLKVFAPPTPPPPEPEPEPKKDVFVPLQSNRLSQFMHPFKKPEHKDECPVEIYATPKVIRKRHYPRPRNVPAPPPPPQSDSEEEESSEEEETSSEDSDEEYDINVVYDSGKVGASTSSNDSGFDSTVNGNKTGRWNKG